MRVGVFSYDFGSPIGGLGVSLQLLERTQKRLFPATDVAVFSPSDGRGDISWIARFFWRRPGGCPVFSLSLLWSMERILRRHRIGVVHVHSGSGGVWLLRKPSCPLVVTAHHTYLQEAKLVYGGNLVTALRKRLMGMLERRTYVLADRVICVSEDTRQALVSQYGIDARKLVTVENAVDMHVVRSEKASRSAHTLLSVGRIEQRKGIWTLLEAFSRLHSTNPSLTLRLAGVNMLGGQLARFLRERRLTECVSVLGFVYEPLRLREIAHATLVVVPSLLEGFGLTAAEAMACGACVIASDCPGLRSVVSHERTGLLFRSGDSASCADAIQRALADPALRERLGNAAREEAEKRFSPERQAREVQAVYEELARSR